MKDAGMSTKWYGHSHNGNGGIGVPELLRNHVTGVAELSAQFAAPFGCSSQAKAMGLLHDLGKYSHQFQRRLTDPSVKARDHATIGALLAAKVGRAFGELPAWCIEGHHIGLGIARPYNEFIDEVMRLFENDPDRFTSADGSNVLEAFRADGLEVPKFNSGFAISHNYLADMLDARVLFSSLVDADFLETEAHFAGDATCPRRPRPEGQKLNVDKALLAFDQYLHRLQESLVAKSPNPVYLGLRQQLMAECRAQGRQQQPGLFTLSAPTGAGKTLAMLGFALEHAKYHDLRCIVLAMPFLNIVDQTARIYRRIFDREQFGDDFLLECHSLADDASQRYFADEQVDRSEDDLTLIRRRRRLLSENWDAPIILTTSTQLLESLFAHKPSRCRKLHRLAGSVILFDEVQTLPPKLAVATLGTLNRLAGSESPYRSTIVFATATQPAFGSLSPRLGSLVDRNCYIGELPEWTPTELVSNTDNLFQIASGRVTVEWRLDDRIKLTELAAELALHPQVMAIVNLKRHAIELAEALRESDSNTYHLSTNMCSQHRLQVLDRVKQRLDTDQAVRLVATQCVEAGVDIDFPRVYRALAPLEAIAQAAGRCNRNGVFAKGVVTVFKPLDHNDDGFQRKIYPPGYSSAVAATESFLNNLRHATSEDDCLPEVISCPDYLRKYYELLYAHHGRDSRVCEDESELIEAIKRGDFAEVARHYRLIQQNVINVLVPYERAEYEILIRDGSQDKMTPAQVRAWIRRARPHSVSVFRPENASADIWNQLLPVPLGLDPADESSHGIATEGHEWWHPANARESYDDFVGLRFADTQWVV